MTADRILGVGVIMVAVVFAGASAAVLRLHYRVLTRREVGTRGLLSWHVATIALAMVGLELLVAAGILDRLALIDVDAWLPFTARLVGYFVLSLLGLAALAIIGRAQLKDYGTPLPPRCADEEPDTPAQRTEDG